MSFKLIPLLLLGLIAGSLSAQSNGIEVKVDNADQILDTFYQASVGTEVALCAHFPNDHDQYVILAALRDVDTLLMVNSITLLARGPIPDDRMVCLAGQIPPQLKGLALSFAVIGMKDGAVAGYNLLTVAFI